MNPALRAAALVWAGIAGASLLSAQNTNTPQLSSAPRDSFSLFMLCRGSTPAFVIAGDDVFCTARSKTTTIRRKGKSATGWIEVLETRAAINELIVDGKWLYWITDKNAIQRASLPESQVETVVPDGPSRLSLIARNGRLYWLEPDGEAPGGLRSVAVSGGEISKLTASYRGIVSGPSMVVADDTHLYWIGDDTFGTILKMPLAGGPPVPLTNVGSGDDRAHAHFGTNLAQDDTYIYYWDQCQRKLMRAPKYPGEPEMIGWFGPWLPRIVLWVAADIDSVYLSGMGRVGGYIVRYLKEEPHREALAPVAQPVVRVDSDQDALYIAYPISEQGDWGVYRRVRTQPGFSQRPPDKE